LLFTLCLLFVISDHPAVRGWAEAVEISPFITKEHMAAGIQIQGHVSYQMDTAHAHFHGNKDKQKQAEISACLRKLLLMNGQVLRSGRIAQVLGKNKLINAA